jgi:hypothetical protein
MHAESSHFVINIHGLHNAQHIRQGLPVDIFVQTPLHIDRDLTMEQAVKAMKTNKQAKTAIATAKKEAKAMVSAAMKEAGQEESESGSKSKRPRIM